MPRVITATIQSENIPSLVNTFEKIFRMMGLYVKTYRSKSSNNYPAHYVRVSTNKYMPENETVSIRIADHTSVQDKSKFSWKKEFNLDFEDEWEKCLDSVCRILDVPTPSNAKLYPVGGRSISDIKPKKFKKQDVIDIFNDIFDKNPGLEDNVMLIRSWNNDEVRAHKGFINHNEMIMNDTKNLPPWLNGKIHILEKKNNGAFAFDILEEVVVDRMEKIKKKQREAFGEENVLLSYILSFGRTILL